MKRTVILVISVLFALMIPVILSNEKPILDEETYLFYQEDANELSDLWGSSPSPEAIDGDWDTHVYYARWAFNYTKPIGATGAILRAKGDLGTFEVQIPGECWNYNQTKLVLAISTGDDSGVNCLMRIAGSEWWDSLVNIGYSDTYEEAIYWVLPIAYYDYQDITDLEAGWNLISSPVEINKTDIYVYYNDTVYTFDEAASQSLIIFTIFGWDRENQQYILSELLYPGEGYWMYAYENCTLMECDRMIFGGNIDGSYVPGGKYFQIEANWGETYANLCYCPDYGWANSISVKLYVDGVGPTATARVALLKPTIANIPPDAPYWEYGVLGPNFPVVITSADIIAVGDLQLITNMGYGNEIWYTFTFPFVPVSPGYYLLAVCGCGNAGATGLGITGENMDDGLLNKGGKATGTAPEHEWPSDLTFVPNDLLNFPMNFDIYCTYQTHVIGLSLTGNLDFGKQSAEVKT